MHAIAAQVDKDIYRTLPEHPALTVEKRQILKEVLLSYAKHKPAVGYCQVHTRCNRMYDLPFVIVYALTIGS